MARPEGTRKTKDNSRKLYSNAIEWKKRKAENNSKTTQRWNGHAWETLVTGSKLPKIS